MISPVQKKLKRDEWLRDIDARQRNVLFPDTAQNEARFWRNLYEGKQRVTGFQTVGLTIMVVLVIGLVIAITLSWGHRGSSWGSTIFSGSLDWILAGSVIGLFLLLMRWGLRKGG